MKHIIITGAAGGIGLACTNYLSKNGYYVYALDIKPMERIENVESFVCDLTKRSDLEQVFALIKDKSKIDAIIHLAGTYRMDSLIEIEEEKLRKVFDINFYSAYLVNKVFFPLLDKGSKIVIVSSELAPLDPLPFNSIYSLSKNTLEQYAFSLGQELNLLGIKVIVVRPGAIDTGLIDESMKNVERIEKETILYQDNAKLFKKIVAKNEAKTIPPLKLAKLIDAIIIKKRNRLVYSINLNIKLIILSMLPRRWQLAIIKKMITPR